MLSFTTRTAPFLIEAVTSHGPVSPKRYYELEKMLSHVPATRVYVSAFPNFKEFKTHITDIAWETEVWISDVPDHLIHFNGPSSAHVLTAAEIAIVEGK